jgi:N-methylhydantoinase A
MAALTLRIGIDVGGTFTDLVVADEAGGEVRLLKVATTPADICRGILAGFADAGIDAAAVAEIAHGTTVATNCLLERTGAPTGLLTTRGFRDVLELRDGARRGLYGLQAAWAPLVPRQHRLEVAERVGPAGEIRAPLDPAEVEAAARRLLADGVEALAVSFLHAHLEPSHERQARAILARCWPNPFVVLGSDLSPFPGEFARTATAVLAATLRPLLDRYVRSLVGGLEGLGCHGALRLIESAGGSVGPDEAARNPLLTILSGPAGGAVAAAALARRLGLPAALSCDMGGTSFDVALIRDGQVALVGEKVLEFGMPVTVPAVDLQPIAMGGGSIAWVDEEGTLRVGPRSAGAVPGPACYGRGGRKPTVTDADLLLNRLPRDQVVGGLGALDEAPARRAMLAEICPAVGGDPAQAAEAILDVAEAHMAAHLRATLWAHGVGPGRASLIAFGGAGPLHAAAIARRAGLPRVIVPSLAAGLSALGCLLADPERVAQAHVGASLEALSDARLAALAAGLVGERAVRAGRFTLLAGLRREPNPHEDLVEVGPGEVRVAVLRERHAALVEERTGHRPAGRDVTLLRLIARVRERAAGLELADALACAARRARADATREPEGEQEVRFEGKAYPTRVVPLGALAPGTTGAGPALVRLAGTGAVVPPEARYGVDEWANLHIEVNDQ